MAPTVEIEATSATTARATLTGADVPPMDLTATEDKALAAVVHEFVRTLAVKQQSAVEVVYRTGKDTRFLTVGPDGTLTENAPSTPIPVTPTEPEQDAAEPASAAPTGPVTVATEPITYETIPQPVAAPVQAPAQPGHKPAPTRKHTPPAKAVTEPLSGRIGALSALSAPRVNPVGSEPARHGARGRLNALLGLTLAPKPHSREMRLRDAQTAIGHPLPDGALITVANVKGGVGKTPMAIGVAETLATYRGPATTACLDLGEIGGSFADRIAVPPTAGQDTASLLAELTDTAHQVRPSMLTRYLTRQPCGSYALAGPATAATSLSYDDATTVGEILGRHYDLLLADTGNSSHADSWRWAISSAHAVLVPVPLRRDSAVAAQRTLAAISIAAPDVLTRTVVVITDGPGDAPMVETDAVDAFSALGVPVCRMPFDPLFASGERITLSGLRRDTREALTVLAATIVDLMAGAVD
ncbi:chromosome partitioning protein ParA (plasmid) [Rhodococcus pyridinivorans SB3094]|uniref:Chromosome partitioning protein ParA n=1 Tax=Rhodococcus pyridinivorans SB3094 TaxID=1435356 RepID=V9XKL1_9NOCA|nr:chromosome partitioning protein ParA [Rhodococcus pyridinivorans]AHD24006.1 chromosome partitioning protein ParA [Rhodococcus pyridinivorans SB3094]